MPRLGAHVPSSDGYARAVEREVEAGGTCGQFSLEPSDGWEVDPVDDERAQGFRTTLSETDVHPWIVRARDPIDLATPDRDVGMRSMRTVQDELALADRLGAAHYVVTPGTHDGTTRKEGIANVVRRLSAVDHDGETTILLENAAGEGSTLGADVGDLADIVDRATKESEEVGLCLDTCSLHAAGYDLRTADGLNEVLDTVESTVGIEHLRCLHLNDSEAAVGSHRDRPAHVGEGRIGESGFERVVNHQWLRDLPMVVEPPDPGRITRDLATVRGLRRPATDRVNR